MTKSGKLSTIVITMAIGLLLTSCGAYLTFWHDSQMREYNQGLSHYRTLQFEESIQAFERADAVYQYSLNRSWFERFVYPKPNREVAALALLHKGNALIRLQQMERAKKAYQESITYNPGSGYLEIPGFMELSLKAKDITRLANQARIAKHNLELLLKNQPPEPKDKKGNGNQLEAEDEEKEQEQIPQLAPGSQPGKGGKDDI